MEEFDESNILSEDDVANLFSDVETEDGEQENDEGKNPHEETEGELGKPVEVDVDKLFDEKPDRVDSDKNQNQGEENPNPEKDGTSPYIYSSIATALKEEGIFPDLDDDTIKKIAKPEDFANVIEEQVKAKFDERQKRIDEALNYGVQPSAIKQYENAISYLDNIKEEDLIAEDEKGEELRKQIIYQDYINAGFSKEKAQKLLQKSLDNGDDIEDAKEALTSNKEYFKKKYETLIEEAKQKDAADSEKKKADLEEIRKSILEDKSFFGDSLTKEDRNKIYDAITKPVYKDPETGNFYTAIQEYEKKNKKEFLRNLGYCFAMTNGFKDFDNLSKFKVKQEVKKGLKALESTLNSTQRDSNGNLNFMSGTGSNSESYFNKGWDLDV